MSVKFNHRRFREVRENRRLTQINLAELAETSDRYIRDMESGKKTNPSAKLLFRAGQAMGVAMEEFMMIEEGEENGI